MKKILLPLILILSLTVAGCTKDHATTPVADQQVMEKNQSFTESSVLAYEDLKLTFADAFDTYMERYPDKKITKVELDHDFGEYVYQVEGYDANKEYEIKINPVSGEIIRERSEGDYDNKGELTRAHAEKVEGIIEKAFQEAGEGATIKGVTLDYDDGRVEVEVEMDKKGLGEIEYKYDIDRRLIGLD